MTLLPAIVAKFIFLTCSAFSSGLSLWMFREGVHGVFVGAYVVWSWQAGQSEFLFFRVVQVLFSRSLWPSQRASAGALAL